MLLSDIHNTDPLSTYNISRKQNLFEQNIHLPINLNENPETYHINMNKSENKQKVISPTKLRKRNKMSH